MIFTAHGYTRADAVNHAAYGFHDLIEDVLKGRDDDELKSALRYHLWLRRREIEQQKKSEIRAYVRQVLNNRLVDLVARKKKVEANEVSYEELAEALEGLNSDDESETKKVLAGSNAEQLLAKLENLTPDPETFLIQQEEHHEIMRAYCDLVAAIRTLPPHLQKLIRLRFIEERTRRDVWRELRMSGLTENDIRGMEDQAVSRLRGQVRLPTSWVLSRDGVSKSVTTYQNCAASC